MTYCNLLFTHVQVKPNQQCKPCCRFKLDKHPELDKFSLNDYALDEVINSSEWEVLRLKSLAGEKIDGCSRCHVEEERNISSMRMGINNKRAYTEDVKLTYVELSFGNFCNLQCRSCSVDLSSSWFEDEKALQPYYKDRTKQDTKVIYVKDQYSLEEYQHVTEIKFTGGEPMLHPNFNNFIDFLIDNNLHKQMRLDIFTNCSWFPKKTIIEKLSLFKHIIINLSIDGIGKVNDYARYPSKWEIVNSSCDKWLKTNFDVRWTPCISVYNANNIIEMFDWWFSKETKIINGRLDVALNTVDFPKYLTPSLVSNKQELIDKLEKNKSQNKFEGILHMHYEHLINKCISAISKTLVEEDLEEFKHFTKDLDKLRKQDIKDFIPELEYDFANYGKL